MTPEKHNKIIGILHLVYGGLQAMIVVLMLLFMGVFAGFAAGLPDTDAPPLAVMGVVMTFVVVFSVLLLLPAFIAGYGMLKHKPWARTAGIVSAVIACLSFPIGTALGVYSLWFLFGDEGKRYLTGGGQEAYLSPPPPANWR